MRVADSQRKQVARTRRRRGLFGVAVLVLAAVGIAFAYLKPNPFSGDRQVEAIFRETSGVAVVGADVRVAGVPVGEITDRRRVGDLALVTMVVEESVGEIRADATAELRPHLPFEGTAFVELAPGSPDAPPLGEDDPIAVDRTRSYVPLDVALRAFTPQSRTGIDRIAEELDRTFSSGEGSRGLDRTLEGAPDLTRTLAPAARAAGGSSGSELNGAIVGLSRTLDALAAEREQLGPLVADMAATTTSLNRPALDATLADLPATLGSVERGSATLERIVAGLDPLAEELEPSLADLAPTLELATPLALDAEPALRQATPLIADLRAALAAGAGAAPSTRRLLRDVQPTLEQADESLIPALLAPTEELGIPAYVSFLNLFGGGGGASRPFTTAAQATPATPETGHFMRFGLRFLTGVGAPLPPCALLESAASEIAAALSAAGGCTP